MPGVRVARSRTACAPTPARRCRPSPACRRGSAPPRCRSRPRPGASNGTRSLRPGCSTPPWSQWTSLASTPKSCCSMPRTHTDAVMVYSGTPTRRPLRSSGLLDPRSRVHEDAAVPEHAGREHRDGDERLMPPGCVHVVRAHGHLGGVELVKMEHAPENLLDRQRHVVQVDALGLHEPVLEGPGAVVVLTRQRQFDVCH